MRLGLKLSISLLISVLLFAGFAAGAFLGLFDLIETRFYHPAAKRQAEAALAAAVRSADAFDKARFERFGAVLAADPVRRSVLPTQTQADIDERAAAFARLLQDPEGADGVRIIDSVRTGVDSAQRRIHFSTWAGDVLSRKDSQITYRNWESFKTDEPYALIEAPQGSAPRLAIAPSGDYLLYCLPFSDAAGLYRGTAVFSVRKGVLVDALAASGSLRFSDDLQAVDGLGWVARVPPAAGPAILPLVAARWSSAAAAETFSVLAETGDGASLVLLSGAAASGQRIGILAPQSSFAIPGAMKAILLSSFFVTVFLLCFLLFNLRQDPVSALRDRVKRFQIGLLEEYLERKGEIDFRRWSRELESRRAEVRGQIKAAVGIGSRKAAPDVDELIDKSWDEIIEVMGSKAAQAGGAIALADVESMLKRLLASGSFVLPAGSVAIAPPPGGAPRASGSAKRPSAGAAAALEAREAEAVEELSDADQAEAVEELSDIDEAEAVEELSDADEVEAVEELSDADEAEAVEELSDIDEAEAAEELSDADEAEAVGELSDIDEAEAVEDLSDADEAEAVEELSDAEEADAVAEPSAAVEAEAAEDVEELAEAEEIEELAEIEEPEAVEELSGEEDAETVEDLVEAEEPATTETGASIVEPSEDLSEIKKRLGVGESGKRAGAFIAVRSGDAALEHDPSLDIRGLFDGGHSFDSPIAEEAESPETPESRPEDLAEVEAPGADEILSAWQTQASDLPDEVEYMPSDGMPGIEAVDDADFLEVLRPEGLPEDLTEELPEAEDAEESGPSPYNAYPSVSGQAAESDARSLERSRFRITGASITEGLNRPYDQLVDDLEALEEDWELSVSPLDLSSLVGEKGLGQEPVSGEPFDLVAPVEAVAVDGLDVPAFEPEAADIEASELEEIAEDGLEMLSDADRELVEELALADDEGGADEPAEVIPLAGAADGYRPFFADAFRVESARLAADEARLEDLEEADEATAPSGQGETVQERDGVFVIARSGSRRPEELDPELRSLVETVLSGDARG